MTREERKYLGREGVWLQQIIVATLSKLIRYELLTKYN